MAIDVKYIGTQARWPELAVTGKQSVWFPGQEEERSDAEAAQLLATGLFSRSEQPLSGAELAATRSLVSGDTTSVATPRAPLLIANNGSVSVHFSPAANATSYRATLSNGSTATGPASPITITSANGAAVTATVTGINATTSATSSASNSVTPTSKPAALSPILGMMAWWDANQLAVVADGTVVASWPDSSGNGYTATPFGSPTYRTAANWGGGTTGKPAVGFNGVTATAQRFETALTGALTGHTITLFAVFDKASTNNALGQPDQRVFTQEATKLDRGFNLMLSNGNYSGGADIFTIRGGTNETNVGGAITLSTPYLVSVVTGKQMFVNGTRQAPVGFSITGPANRTTPYTLGHMYGGNGGVGNNSAVGLQGRIAEVMVFRGQLSDTDRFAVENYIATKYALSVANQASL